MVTSKEFEKALKYEFAFVDLDPDGLLDVNIDREGCNFILRGLYRVSETDCCYFVFKIDSNDMANENWLGLVTKRVMYKVKDYLDPHKHDRLKVRLEKIDNDTI